MTIKEQLAEKKQALIDLEPMLKAEDVTDETIATGEALVKEIDELTEKCAQAEKAEALLKTIGNPEETNTDPTEEKKMNEIETFVKSASEMSDRKSGVKMHLKAATDVVTSVQVNDIDRTVAPQPTRRAVADYFTTATVKIGRAHV